MGRSLVIVESPAKAKTINKYLGKDFIVKSSIGHIRDLPKGKSEKSAADLKERAKKAAEVRKLSPEAKAIHKKQKAKEQLVRSMGIDPENDWDANYEILPDKQKVISELTKLAKNADYIYLATDLDREGEAIAWHLREVIGGDDEKFRRVVFNEITKKAIKKAFDQPGQLDMNHVHAQQARRFLDRVVGFMLSPLLWEKIARGLSAGRVQSVAVKLIVEREREIRAFIPEEYWEIHADLAHEKTPAIQFQVSKEANKAFRPTNEASAKKAADTLKKADFFLKERIDKPTSSRPNPPLITSTLQQASSTRLGFGVKKTMLLAQRLYEAGLITYMRTDSTNISTDAIHQCRDLIQSAFGDAYLPEKPIFYRAKSTAQEAHEAIRPTDLSIKSDALSGVENDAKKLYDLIWRQFVACQMSPAEYLSTTLIVEADVFELRAKGRILKFDGYTKVFNAISKKDDDIVLPDIKVQTKLDLEKLLPSQHFTKPLARYSEASLVKELEKRGIGRPSTYANIISTIQDRGYVQLNKRRFYAQKIGEIVAERLQENFEHLMSYDFTARLEDLLDKIANSQANWKMVLNEFYADFSNKLSLAYDETSGMRSNKPIEIDVPCPSCKRPMQIRTASTGVFLGCSGYALPPKERCKTTMNLIPGDEAIVDIEEDEEAESKLLRLKRRCKTCSTAMESYLIDEKRKIHICGNNPDCSGYEIEEGQFKIKGYEGPVITCDKCESNMQLKAGRFGKYFGCTNADCKNTRKLLRNGEAAPPKSDPVPMPELRCEKSDDFFILRDGAAGLFLAASQFPKHRETRAPLLEELLAHKDEIPEKYQFLLNGPLTDPKGNKTIIRYSRKLKQQYLMTEENKKATKWKAYFKNNTWQTETVK